jgi:hypothetical protein
LVESEVSLIVSAERGFEAGFFQGLTSPRVPNEQALGSFPVHKKDFEQYPSYIVSTRQPRGALPSQRKDAGYINKIVRLFAAAVNPTLRAGIFLIRTDRTIVIAHPNNIFIIR